MDSPTNGNNDIVYSNGPDTISGQACDDHTDDCGNEDDLGVIT